ncbi:pentapeptide repeat-containing protein [Amycolatopsis sp. WGS_07]|uniref:pentapeptide repeat-containing protein n=1 Tax=Amycolatopsis sp. WGS_07 TaxID=3076764 RepID=UPI00387398F9
MPGSRSRSAQLTSRVWWVLAASVLVATAAAGAVLWWAGTRGLSGADLARARFDSVKIALSLGAGAGAAIGLYLAWRRQRSTEQAAADTRHDAEQRRVTELYAKAAEMLGADRAAVRMAGLYALERLAQDQPSQRRPVVNLFCAYLRMPPSADGDTGVSADPAETPLANEGRQEVEVRFAVQGLLRRHVHSGPVGGEPPSAEYWGDALDVSLVGATLMNLTLDGLRLHPNTRFTGARFVGDLNFAGTVISGPTWFNGAVFLGKADFRNATFVSGALFRKATFTGSSNFGNVSSPHGVELDGAMASAREEHRWPAGWRALPPAEGSDGFAEIVED